MSVKQLSRISESSKILSETHSSVKSSAKSESEKELEWQLFVSGDSIKQLTGESGDTTASIFKMTLLHVMKDRPLTTASIHKHMQNLHPDLCDDSEDRNVNGVYYRKAVEASCPRCTANTEEKSAD